MYTTADLFCRSLRISFCTADLPAHTVTTSVLPYLILLLAQKLVQKVKRRNSGGAASPS
jgi:hypothetical protein